MIWAAQEIEAPTFRLSGHQGLIFASQNSLHSDDAIQGEFARPSSLEMCLKRPNKVWSSANGLMSCWRRPLPIKSGHVLAHLTWFSLQASQRQSKLQEQSAER